MSQHTLTLSLGYKSGDGTTHKEVTFGRRPTGADLFRIEGDDISLTPFQTAMLQAAITRFGSLPMPTPITTLLRLTRPDLHALRKANNEFLKATAGGRKSEKLSPDTLKLAFGFQIGGVTFDVVQFGKLLTGYDELRADELEGWRRSCFLMGEQITKLSQTEGQAELVGPVAVEAFEGLDAADIFKLQEFEAEWLDSFQASGGEVSGDAGGGSGLSDAPPAPAGE